MTTSPQRRRRLGRIAAITAAALVAGGIASGPAAFAADRTAFPDAKPTWAKSANDAGAAADTTTFEGYVALPLQDPDGAKAFATAVSTPLSGRYHRFISSQAWIAKYAPTKADVADVVTELKKEGLVIEAIPASRIFVAFRGTAAQLESAFSTSIHKYRVGGHTLLAPATTPSLPSALASHVSEVSISTGATTRRPGAVHASSAPAVTQLPLDQQIPCSAYYGEKTATVPLAYGKTVFNTNTCGYTAKQTRAISGTNANDGAGQTVAIVDAYASPTIVSDTNRLAASQGEPGITGLYSEIGVDRSKFVDQAACQGEEGWQGEQSLDVQAVHAVAPRARIVYSSGFNCGAGLYDGLARVLDQQAASVVTNSYGGAEVYNVDADFAIYDALGWQAAAEGIGLYASSGDDGDLTADGIAKGVEFPAAHPFFTAVGGTSVGVDKSNRLAFETGWGDDRTVITPSGYATPVPGDFFAGAGGGVSTTYAEPAYQRGVVPSSIAGGQRAVPDIASLADPYTGFLSGYSPILADGSTATGDYSADPIGGTSLASPITAAQIVVAQQRTGLRFGFANPLLYGVDRILPAAFRDVQAPASPLALASYSPGKGANVLVTLDRDSSLTTTRGWDTTTGIGALSLDGYRRIIGRY